MSLLRFCALIVVISLLSMEGQRALRFHQKDLNLSSEIMKVLHRLLTTRDVTKGIFFMLIGVFVLTSRDSDTQYF